MVGSSLFSPVIPWGGGVESQFFLAEDVASTVTPHAHVGVVLQLIVKCTVKEFLVSLPIVGEPTKICFCITSNYKSEPVKAQSNPHQGSSALGSDHTMTHL